MDYSVLTINYNKLNFRKVNNWIKNTLAGDRHVENSDLL